MPQRSIKNSLILLYFKSGLAKDIIGWTHRTWGGLQVCAVVQRQPHHKLLPCLLQLPPLLQYFRTSWILPCPVQSISGQRRLPLLANHKVSDASTLVSGDRGRGLF